MSKLREARQLLADHGVGANSYYNENRDCYCSIGALQKAWSGDPDSAYHDITTNQDLSEEEHDNLVGKRQVEFGADVAALWHAICGEVEEPARATVRVRHLIENWNDKQFEEAWHQVDPRDIDSVPRSRALAKERVVALFDRAITGTEGKQPVE